ncbi:hypothetical protein CJ030_MR4G004189 [Morella rubra]|uniref:Receptor-like serine/threonine-protein kinase n=1 Tax=Morella rubra TaxID=262757 RepID=A0A6A1VXF2_9ROSI|nr:hypothetical protein CJ030_MR4G004189 [Morella rubra]
MEVFTYLFVCTLLFSLLRTSFTLDTITPSQFIRDGETLVSSGRTFQLGFFSPGSSKSRYVGIWYVTAADTVVWVANRDSPISDHYGVLKVAAEGVLVILNSSKTIVWSSNTSRTAENPVARLLDNGNLVVKDGNVDDSENFLWQSFDYPCDTLLPEMKLGRNFGTGLDRFVSSWKSKEDPSQGQYSIRIDPRGFPQMVAMDGARILSRAGPWNGLEFTGYPNLIQNPVFQYEFVLNENEVYYEYKLKNSTLFSRLVLNPSGTGGRFTWIDRTHSWEVFSTTSEADQCEKYAFCGAYATCNPSNSLICACLEGFIPKSQKDWNGCFRRTPLECNGGDGFLESSGMKLPDTSSSWFNKTMSLEECKGLCLENCSCTAYSSLDIRGNGSGCLLWFGILTDMKVYSQGGQNLYIRIASSEIGAIKRNRHSNKIKQAGIIVGSAILVIAIITLGMTAYMRKKKLSFKAPNISGTTKRNRKKGYDNEGWNEDMEIPIFHFTDIANATKNFSSDNKLGEGGFGPVYMGTLLEGQVIAVKRLSKNSGQGMNEFRNEVKLIAKLQHRNLVKLLGCCVQENEKMLIYEYMPNKSLDSFIFDQTKSKLLDWHKRINIISGTARGLLYLHEDSRLRVIHRDLKASNILLDKDMNPKISDFGLARSFVGDQLKSKTSRIAGTFGYMSPEYAVHGQYSVKSDVFSFGVLVLEIVSGKKNREFLRPHQHLNLLGHAWKLWIEDRPMELIAESIGDSYTQSEMLRCIHVGLLCVQQRPENRPNMSSVVLMLSSDGLLPKPRHPGFYTDSNEADFSACNEAAYSANETSITLFEAR